MKQVKKEVKNDEFFFEDKKIICDDKEHIFWILDKNEELIVESCYFCDFREILHKHHIIRKKERGSNSERNLLNLCPNHHSLIHQGKYILFFKGKYYYLKEINGDKLIPPFKKDENHLRKLPLTDIKYNKNLITEGDINSKAKIKIKKAL